MTDALLVPFPSVVDAFERRLGDTLHAWIADAASPYHPTARIVVDRDASASAWTAGAQLRCVRRSVDGVRCLAVEHARLLRVLVAAGHADVAERLRLDARVGAVRVLFVSGERWALATYATTFVPDGPGDGEEVPAIERRVA